MKVPLPSKVTPRTRKRRTRRLWSRPRRPLVPREYLRLPTRETLTYAEAQKFVDVDTDGEIHRLNICEPLEFIPGNAFNDEMGKGNQVAASGVITCPASVSALCTDDSCSMSAISKLPQPVVRVVEGVHPSKTLYKRQVSYFRNIEKTPEELNEEIEYDMDEEDVAWLKRLNELRRKDKLVPLSDDGFERVIDRIEKEAFLLTVAGGREFSVSGVVCEICMDSECQSSNVILKCDTCNMAVHQDCYGVPFLPEGQWLCKKCLKSPNTLVDCCLCPVKDGPLKQTDDGRWAHVLCAFWVPEVGFGSAVYLEPVEKIDRVPESRFRLRCDICKQQGRGACIKCQASGCDRSFHATCAMKGSLFMKMEAVPENGSRTNYRKTFFCNQHRPVEASLFQSSAGVGIGADDDASRSSMPGSSSKALSRSKSKKSKKLLAEQPRNQPAMSVPAIPSKRLVAIADNLNVRDRRQLVARVHSYWLLKRQSRNGYPLIQRLHSTLAAHHFLRSRDPTEAGVDEHGLKFVKKLRQDLEKVRLLLELIRKREKLKCEHIKLREMVVNLQLQPFVVLLKHTLSQLQAKDPTGIFAFPVPVSEVPDYLDCITHPMDFLTMREKIESHFYQTVDDFEADFQLVVNNCLKYNQKGSSLYKVALKLREQGSVIISAARRMSERAGYCLKTGLHRLHEGDVGVRNGDSSTSHHLKSSRAPEDGLEGRLRELLKRLDVLQVVRSVHNALLAKRLKKEIATCRRKLTMSRQDQGMTNGMSAGQQYQSVLNSCSVNLNNNFSCLKKLSPKAVNSLTRSCRVSVDGRLGQDVEQMMKDRTRNCVRGRLKSAISLLESSSAAVDNCNSNVTVASDCIHSTVATVTCDDEITSRHVSHIRTRQDALISHKETIASMMLVRNVPDAKVVANLSVCVSMPLKLNGQLSDPTHLANSSVVTTRSASRRLSLGGQDVDNLAPKHTVKRQLSTPPLNSSGIQSRQRTCGRFHMIAQPIVLADSTENDSSYESSYSMLSDSELSKCNSPDSQNGGSLFMVATTKKSRSNCSVEALDTSTPLVPRDVVWAKSKGYPWYPATIVDPDVCPDNDGSKIAPPKEVLALRPKGQEPVYLIRFFDKRRNWQWLSRNKLEPLGFNGAFDTAKIMEIKQCKLRRDVRRAYDEATKTCSVVSTHRNSFSKP